MRSKVHLQRQSLTVLCFLFTAAAAAKINAQLQAKKGIQHVDVPPIRTVNISYITPLPSHGFT